MPCCPRFGEKNKKVLKKLIEKYGMKVNDVNQNQEFPIPIDEVIYPLIEGCKKYSEETLKD